MHPGGMRSAMDLFDFEKSANLKHPNDCLSGKSLFNAPSLDSLRQRGSWLSNEKSLLGGL